VIWLSITVVALVAVVAICCGALVEVFTQLAELRASVNLEDEPRPLEIHEGQLSTTDAGFPRAVAELLKSQRSFCREDVRRALRWRMPSAPEALRRSGL
jgi:hypothetical protein